MKFLLICVLLGTTFADDSVNLQQPFVDGADTIPALVLNELSGNELKEELLGAFSKYLTLLSSSWDFAGRASERSLYQWLSNYSKHLEYLMSQLNAQSTATHFDSFLEGMIQIYGNVSEVFPSSKTIKPEVQSIHSVDIPETKLVYFPMNQIFLNASNMMLSDLLKLGSWTNTFINNGIATVATKLPDIQEGIRQRYLYPNVKVLQRYAEGLKDRDEVISEKSTKELWEKYTNLREKILELNVPE